ncbi:UvrD-helicase domain-containing protein [Sphingosinicella sp. BN140058]|uniref:UvrD-helicase domain-containing protein n=1 Tax=Sphingosinicella sp. BN140058 TaxID=1892855 RepID=UPI0010103B29|nr:UvrD-helicase domain-containing protein [Sphingosinicella sp. BN140058]QAY80130.1 ATP-dependent helicase [Sphingosinicella sp. BN140058]
MATAPKSHVPIGVSGHPLTAEQQALIASPPSETARWIAGAGCSKTTSLVEYAHAWSDYSGLYLAFNAPIAAEAKGRFPRHIRTQTAHAHAYQLLNMRRHQDRIIKSNLRPDHLDGCQDLLRLVGSMKEQSVRRAVLRSIQNFLISGDYEVREYHLSGFPIQTRAACVPMVSAIIDRFMDFDRSELPITHDMYLKKFQLTRAITGFDYLLLDEAQDWNPVLLEIARKAQLPSKVVGDPWQSIYAFRGAENAMDSFPGPVFPLSKSFRFGPKIAAVANYVLSQSLTPPTWPLVGFEKQESFVLPYEGRLKRRCTILARTNFRLFEGLVAMKLPYHMVGGIDELISQVRAGYALYTKQPNQFIDPLVSRFLTWDDCKEAAKAEEDPDLIRLVRIVEQYTTAIPEILVDIKARFQPDETDAQLILSTGHKAKGREWDNTVVLDDFLGPNELRAMLSRKRITPTEYNSEINLLYVVLTRGRQTLSIAQPLYDEIMNEARIEHDFDIM